METYNSLWIRFVSFGQRPKESSILLHGSIICSFLLLSDIPSLAPRAAAAITVTLPKVKAGYCRGKTDACTAGLVVLDSSASSVCLLLFIFEFLRQLCVLQSRFYKGSLQESRWRIRLPSHLQLRPLSIVFLLLKVKCVS